jgi:hypothetical protein
MRGPFRGQHDRNLIGKSVVFCTDGSYGFLHTSITCAVTLNSTGRRLDEDRRQLYV